MAPVSGLEKNADLAGIFMNNIYEHDLIRELKDEKGKLIFSATDIYNRFCTLAFRDSDIRAITFFFEASGVNYQAALNFLSILRESRRRGNSGL